MQQAIPLVCHAAPFEPEIDEWTYPGMDNCFRELCGDIFVELILYSKHYHHLFVCHNIVYDCGV